MSAAILLNLVRPELKKLSEKFDLLTDYLKRVAGGEFLSFNNSVFLSERETADRNFALAYYMRENGCFPAGFRLQECLDFYFQVVQWWWWGGGQCCQLALSNARFHELDIFENDLALKMI